MIFMPYSESNNPSSTDSEIQGQSPAKSSDEQARLDRRKKHGAEINAMIIWALGGKIGPKPQTTPLDQLRG
jgi:hypothetical protein